MREPELVAGIAKQLELRTSRPAAQQQAPAAGTPPNLFPAILLRRRGAKWRGAPCISRSGPQS